MALTIYWGGEDLGRTGLEMVLVLGYVCQIRDAIEISMGEMFCRQLNI